MKDSSPCGRKPFDYVREVTPEDLNAIGRTFHLRNIDILEGHALTGKDPYDALKVTIQQSELLFSLHAPIGLVGFTGIVKVDETTGAPWMVGSDDLEKQGKPILAHSLNTLKILGLPYHFLFNFVACENVRSIRWLEWLGFTVDLAPQYFHDPLVPFHLFYKEQ